MTNTKNAALSATLPFNPLLVSSPANTFDVVSTGAYQGSLEADPTVENQVIQGVVAKVAPFPLYGGVPIIEALVDENTLSHTYINVSPTVNEITGVTTNFQSVGTYIYPGSNVPQAPVNGNINFFRLGSNARIWMNASAAAVASLFDGPINKRVTYNFTTMQIEVMTDADYPFPGLVVQTMTSGGMVVTKDTLTDALNYAPGLLVLVQLSIPAILL